MEFLDLFLNLHDFLTNAFQSYGSFAYIILFIIMFCETGLVIAPFLPGDSLVLLLGVLAADHIIDPIFTIILLSVASILGAIVNYQIGYWLRHKLADKSKKTLIKREYIDQTHHFFEKHGGKTIVIARFVPVVRTFAPFVAGMVEMNYLKFLIYSIGGGILWVGSFILAGFFFGKIPIVMEYIDLVITVILISSLVPIISLMLVGLYKKLVRKKG